MALALAAAAASTAAAMYMDARFSLRGDISLIRAGFGTKKYYENLMAALGEEDWSFYHILDRTRGTNDDVEALVFESRSWTYAQMREEIGVLAIEFQRLGIENRTVVGIFANNSPEFMFAWWALLKIGAIPAPLNTAINGEHIRHCLKISSAQYLICTDELYPVAEKALFPDAMDWKDLHLPQMKEVILLSYGTYGPRTWSHPRLLDLDMTGNLVRDPRAADFLEKDRPRISMTEPMEYLFTSGTTGLPKAAIWPLGYAYGTASYKRPPGLFDKYRRFYICLPLFHGTAQFAALPAVFATSGTVILARKFSRSGFWPDIRRSKANALLYIGEMMRYLVQAPPDPAVSDEKSSHNVELAFGLGLAPTIWAQFRERFGVPWIAEYYSATEATVSLVLSNKNSFGVGKVARWGPIYRLFQNAFYIVRVDQETGDLMRDPKTGFCIKTQFGEVGESIARIVPPIQRSHDYVGEGGEEATRKKILHDVFARGDMFIRLGDAMMIDADGFISFQDRLGDTYRAKGHNISTTEVENVLMHHPLVQSANVYAIPMNNYGYEGQVGCAAITISGEDSASGVEAIVGKLENWMRMQESALPAYSVPRFVRVLREDVGRTLVAGEQQTADGASRSSLIMKKLKTGLKAEGFTLPASSPDQVFWIDKEGDGYKPLTPQAIQEITSGKARL